MPRLLDNWFEEDESSCNISPLHVVNALKNMNAPKGKIKAARVKADTCNAISNVLGLKCLKGWKFSSYLGSGNNGTVFSIQNSAGTVRAAKIVSVDPKSEVRVQKKMANIGIAPKVYKSCKLSDRLWVIIMEKIDGSLGDLVGGHRSLSKKMLAEIFQEIERNIDRLEKSNVTHGDLSLENVGYVIKEDGNVRLMIIDFGWNSRYVPMFDMVSLAQALLFTRNKKNRDYLYDRIVSFINDRYDFILPKSTVGVDTLFRDFQTKFVKDLRKSI